MNYISYIKAVNIEVVYKPVKDENAHKFSCKLIYHNAPKRFKNVAARNHITSNNILMSDADGTLPLNSL